MALWKKVVAVGGLLAFSFAVFAATQHPSSPTASKMKGSTMNGKRPLKAHSEDKMVGRVKDVQRVHEPDGVKIHITLQTSSGVKSIVLGPASYLDQSRIALQSGEKVTIYGYEVSANGKQMWIATKIDKNGHVVNLRQQNGASNWQSNREGNARMQ